MGDSAGTADRKNAVFILEFLEGKARWFIPLQQMYFHEGLYSQNPASVITRNIRFRDLAFIKDGGNGSGGIHKYRIARPDSPALFPVDFLCPVKSMLDVVIFGIGRYDPFFWGTNLLFLLFGCGDCIALVDPPADLFEGNRAVQENGDPVSPADVIAAKTPGCCMSISASIGSPIFTLMTSTRSVSSSPSFSPGASMMIANHLRLSSWRRTG